jgi:hypothetical protein
MKRGFLILALGLAAAVVAFCCVYRIATATPRALLQSAQPELAWLKHEFHLGDAEFQRISELHAGYQPQCMEHCRRIESLNAALSTALADATQVTPEIVKLLDERARMRSTCQAQMLKHFFEVSRTMPSEQGKRYLAWVRDITCLREQGMNHGAGDSHAATPPSRQP